MCNLLISRLFFFVSYLDTVGFWPGFWWQRGLFLLIFHDLYFVSSDVEINFSLGQKQTVLLMCGLRGQLFPFGRCILLFCRNKLSRAVRKFHSLREQATYLYTQLYTSFFIYNCNELLHQVSCK